MHHATKINKSALAQQTDPDSIGNLKFHPLPETVDRQAPFGISFRNAGEVWFDNMRHEEIVP